MFRPQWNGSERCFLVEENSNYSLLNLENVWSRPTHTPAHTEPPPLLPPHSTNLVFSIKVLILCCNSHQSCTPAVCSSPAGCSPSTHTGEHTLENKAVEVCYGSKWFLITEPGPNYIQPNCCCIAQSGSERICYVIIKTCGFFPPACTGWEMGHTLDMLQVYLVTFPVQTHYISVGPGTALGCGAILA